MLGPPGDRLPRPASPPRPQLPQGFPGAQHCRARRCQQRVYFRHSCRWVSEQRVRPVVPATACLLPVLPVLLPAFGRPRRVGSCRFQPHGNGAFQQNVMKIAFLAQFRTKRCQLGGLTCLLSSTMFLPLETATARDRERGATGYAGIASVGAADQGHRGVNCLSLKIVQARTSSKPEHRLSMNVNA